jgi:hypothetical protein
MTSDVATPKLYPRRALALTAAWGTSAVLALAGFTRCPSAVLFHRACPGCGVTRALRLFAHGEIAASFALHPLALPATLATFALAVALSWVTLVRGTPTAILGDRFGRAAAIAFLVVQEALIFAWLARALGALGGLPPAG